MASIPVGPNGSFTLVVTAEHLANRFKDTTLPPVLATPVMIMAMENAALNAIKPLLKERSEEHTSELQSRLHLVCRLLLEKKKKAYPMSTHCTLDTLASDII